MEKLEPQNKFHSTYLLINLLKNEVETGTLEYISQYLFTHKFTAQKQLFIIRYQWVVLKIRFHYLVEFTSLKSKGIIRTDIYFLECTVPAVFLIKTKRKPQNKQKKLKENPTSTTPTNHPIFCGIIIEFPVSR